MRYTRICPLCKKKLFYYNINYFNLAENNNKSCAKCKKSLLLKYDDAKKIIKNLSINNQDGWQKFVRNSEFKKLNIPSNPDVFYYNNGWISWADWLNNNENYIHLRKIEYLSYKDCKDYILKNFSGNKNKSWWIKLDKKLLPLNIPKRPDIIYKNSGWINWENFLDSPISPRSKSKIFLSYSDARDYVIRNNILSESHYYDYIDTNKIDFLPLRPDNHYKKEWNGFISFLCIKSKRRSTGEDMIESFLDNMNIKYEREKKFDGCINKKHLPFDFYLSDMNICIEYDGEFHYKYQKHFGSIENFRRIKKNDEIKNLWCLENNINLIRIPYTKKWKIKEFLEIEFKKYG